MSPLIRPATPGDLPAVSRVLGETWRHALGPVLGLEAVEAITGRWHAPEALARDLDRPDHAFLVAEEQGGTVATASARLSEDGTAILDRLYVLPERQGGGIGRALMGAAFAALRPARLHRLEVAAANGAARAFYERQGFSLVAERPSEAVGLVALYERPVRPASAALTLRPVRDGDAQDLYGLVTLCFAEFPGCFTDPHGDLPDLRAPATAIALKPGGAFWVVEDGGGRVCACVCVDFPEPGTAELHRLYVRPDQRRQGLAERLVRLVEAHAAGQGARRVMFWSDTRFTGAHRLYERLGYVRGPVTRDLGDVSNSVEYFYEKGLRT